MFRILWATSNEDEPLKGAFFKRSLSDVDCDIVELQLSQNFESDSEVLLSTIQSSRPGLVLFESPRGASETVMEFLKLLSVLKSSPDTETLPLFVLFHARSYKFGSTAHTLDPQVKEAFEKGAYDVLILSETSSHEQIHAKIYEEAVLRIQSALRHGRRCHQAITLSQQLSKMNADLYERNLQVEKELYVTRQLQQSLLPPYLPSSAGGGDMETELSISKCHYHNHRMRISGLYLPCDALGGDFYDVAQFGDDTVGVSLADVSGHGVPAAFITAMYKSAFYRISHNYSAANDILHHINNELIDIVKTGDYITALYMRIMLNSEGAQIATPSGNSSDIAVEFSGAGHPYPLYYSARTGQIQRLTENGPPLVWVRNSDYPLMTFILEPNDKLLLYTDGVTDIRNRDGDLLGEKALESAFLELVDKEGQVVLDSLLSKLSDFADAQALEDDMSMVLIEAL